MVSDNFSELNNFLAQAQALEYDNHGARRQCFPARFTLVRGGELALLATQNRAYALLSSRQRPDIKKVVELLEQVK